MFKRLALLLLLGLTQAQAGQLPLLGAGGVVRAPAYVGPGDLVSGAKLFYGLRGYNAAYSGNAINLCLPADSTCADVTVSAGNLVIPGSLSTCNNSTVICTIKIFYDQSGALACGGAACNLTQTTIAGRATFIKALAANGCPSISLPCAGFANVAAYVAAGSNPGIVAAYTISAVAVRTGTFTTYNAIMALNSANDGLYFGPTANLVDLFAGADHTAAQTDSSWHAAQAISNDTSSSLNIDGSQTTFTATAQTSTNLIGLGTDNVGDTCTCKMTEVIAWPSAISAGNITAMNSNQHTYWGF